MSKAYIVAAEDMEFVKRYFYVWVPANISEETARIDVLYRYLGNGTNLADVLILDCGGVE